MRSHLTRDVFRRILANEPIFHRRCLRQLSHRSPSSTLTCSPLKPRHVRAPAVSHQQHRALGGFNFNIFSNRREEKEADLESGIDKMMELAKKERMQARLPPLQEVVLAFQQLFDSKARKTSNLTDTEAQLALQSLRYILSSAETLALEDLLSDETMSRTLKVLRSSTYAPGLAHSELAQLLFDSTKPSTTGRESAFMTLVMLLCRSGQTFLARDLVVQYEASLPISTRWYSRGMPQSDVQDVAYDEGEINAEHAAISANAQGAVAWRHLLEGFVLEGREDEVRQTLATLEERGDSGGHRITLAMIDFSMQTRDVDALTKWWKRAFQYGGTRSMRSGRVGRTLRTILAWCLANGREDIGHELVRDMLQSNPRKPLWDEVFIWAAATGKGADEVDRMISVMEESNSEERVVHHRRFADIDTINGLIEYAVSQNDPYLAERFIALGRDRNIQPDARTFVLQMQYRLKVNDTDGALVAYKNLQSQDTSSQDDVPTVNQLIVALCRTTRHDFETIMNVAADLSDRQARFDPDTVSALSILHLNRDEQDDVIDLLNTHAFHYSSNERSGVRNTILAFSLDPNTPITRAWTAYKVLVEIFDELARSERMQLMSAFFERGRPDLAVHVFQNMRRHSRSDTIPNIDTYVAAFVGLAKARVLEGLEVVHNQLKLDYNITPTTQLHTSLIIAYTACGKARNALAFWEDIVASREGPTYNSIHASLRACEKAAWGDVRAKKIWDMLQKRKVDLDSTLWASYIAALAGNGDVTLALDTLREAEANGEVEPDWFMLGSLHYVVAGNDAKQAEVKAFAQETYPVEWEKLEKLGVEEDAQGLRRFKIDRKVGPS